MKKSENPWRSISPDDYEKHMGHPAVNQQQFLSKCFKTSLKNNTPEKILIIGCGTGCGLEHVDSSITNRVTVIDINAEFLKALKQRYQNKISGLETMNNDLYEHNFGDEKFSLVYAGLVFEFVNPKRILNKLSECLQEKGRLEFVLQLPNEHLPAVSSTNIDSIKQLSSFAKLVDVDDFCKECNSVGLSLVESSIETLDSGKSFFLGSAKKSGA